MLPPDCRCYLINLDRSPERLEAMRLPLRWLRRKHLTFSVPGTP